MKTYFRFLRAMVIIAVVVLTFTSCVSSKDDKNEKMEYRLPSLLCSNLFGCSPEEFLETDAALYISKNDFRTNAEVDEDGNLILQLNDAQVEDWIKFYLSDGHLAKADNSETIEISSDYKEATVYCYQDTVLSDVPTAIGSCRSMALYQIISGIDPNEVSVKVTLINPVTKNLVYSFDYPVKEKISLGLEELDYFNLPSLE